jgi:hypothetical protein
VKKAWLVIALTALGGLAANTFADVQNIRLSGDIRVRGYYLADAGTPQNEEATFISQRTRVCVEADLEDHVLVVVTLKAEGLWGSDNNADESSGAGTSSGAGSDAINRRWEVGVTEAYLQLNELFYSPATLKLGRQYLHYGRGLILSSAEQEYNFDAARLVLDFYPFTLDLVGASAVNNQSFTANPSGAGGAEVLFVNGRYEMNADNAKVNLEGYLGWLAQHGQVSSSRVSPSSTGSSPVILGLRTDIAVPGFTTWAEAAYEPGSSGTNSSNKEISAWLANVGFKVGSKDWKMSPTVNANYTYASGGGSNGRANFIPWFDYVDGYNGYLFAPLLSNLHILNAGGSIKPAENLTLGLQAYYYLKADNDSPVSSNSNVDFGGLGYSGLANLNNSADLGAEIDVIAGYDYSKDVRLQLVYGMFIPMNAYKSNPAIAAVAQEVRGEVNVKF